MENEEKVEYTWSKLKKFVNGLTDRQLEQEVKIFVGDDESPTTVDCAEELGEDHYYFPEHEYSFTKDDFDKDCICGDDGKPMFKTFEEAINSNEEFYKTPADKVYLHAFL